MVAEQSGGARVMRGMGRSAAFETLRPDSAPEAVRLVTAALTDRKAVDPVVLDLRGLTAATDYFVIASGTSDAHVRGMAESVLADLSPRGVAPHHVEGLPQGRWVLLDYVDFVVHVFHPELRDFYQLERLWSDAPVLFSAPEGGAKG
jgi:ribosome-associated protein